MNEVNGKCNRLQTALTKSNLLYPRKPGFSPLTINGFDGAINGIKSLIKWKKLHPPKAIRFKPENTAFPLMASNAKTIDGTQETPTQTS